MLLFVKNSDFIVIFAIPLIMSDDCQAPVTNRLSPLMFWLYNELAIIVLRRVRFVNLEIKNDETVSVLRRSSVIDATY